MKDVPAMRIAPSVPGEKLEPVRYVIDPRLEACIKALLMAEGFSQEVIDFDALHGSPLLRRFEVQTRAVILKWLEQPATEGMDIAGPFCIERYAQMCAQAAKEIGGG